MPPKSEVISTARLVKIKDRAAARRKNGEFKDVMELANILISEYVEKQGTLEIASPFGGIIKFGKFNNAEGADLQIKAFTAEEDHPGAASGRGVKWPNYKTFCRFLDDIDRITVRDYSGYKIEDKELNKLAKNGLKIMDRYDAGKIDDKRIKEEEKAFFKKGTGRKILAKQILDCMSSVPDIDEEEIELDKIPKILSAIMVKVGQDCKVLEEHQTDQIRAATMLFGVAICEAFRIDGALKHIRQCLRVVEQQGLAFSEVFGQSKDLSICFLSPKNGTARTRKVFESGLSKDDTETKGWDLSDSSDDEMPEGHQVIIKEVIKAKQTKGLGK